MFKKMLIAAFALMLTTPVFADTLGTINYRQILENYAKAKAANSEIDDKASELQRFILDKEKEFKKMDSPIQKKNFEASTAKTFEQKREALAKFKEKKEQEIDNAIQAAIKSVAIENKIDTVVDYRVIYFGGADITDKVIKKLNATSSAK